MRSRILPLAAGLLLATGCGATVQSSVAPNANLSRYRSFAFHTPAYKRGQTRSVAEETIESALRQDLREKGLVEAQAGTRPDFLVAYHLKEQQQLDVETMGYAYGWGMGGVDAYSYTQGTIIVDFIDPRTNSAFWRGTASQVVSNPSSPDPDKIEKAVAKLVDRYPSQMASTQRTGM